MRSVTEVNDAILPCTVNSRILYVAIVVAYLAVKLWVTWYSNKVTYPLES